MRRSYTPLVLALTLAAIAGCDFLDPTGVTNPTVTEESFVDLPNAAETWAHGVERQLAVTVNSLVLYSEVGSDNLFNNRTLYTRTFDIPQMNATDAAVVEMQREVQELREMAVDGLEIVVPADEDSTPEVEARLHFYRGYAHLASAEYFVALPAEPEGPAVGPETHLALAIQDFEQTRTLSSDATLRAAALLKIARAQHRAGNRDAAVAAAEGVLGEDPTLVRWVEFDQTDGPTNTMQTAIYDSGQDEFQPLPRLDFLFPKYYSESATDEKPIAIAKAEEAHLIVAEAQLSLGQLGEARATLNDLLDLVGQRPIAMVDDGSQARGRSGGTWIYPNSSDVLVAASPQDNPRAGLVLDRGARPVEVPAVSGTSVSSAMLADAATEEELLELLYLMRQEIFVVEGRRMIDLGIRAPVALDEAEANENIEVGSEVTQPRIPSWIPGERGMNTFDYEDGDALAVIHHNLNRVLVENRTNEAVLPFH